MGDEEQMKLCTNCARDIPAANFTIHSVYCSRNIAICPKCREPIPVVDMKTHLAHVPCKQCGEHIQRCDMAMHQSDACAQTAVQCSYCTLTLDRALMAEHEVYCGARTERCADCRELVMMKYRRLHEETNHGFIKLDDEPGPQPSWVVPVSNSNPSSQKAKPQIVRYTDQSPSNPPSNLQRQPSRPEEPGHKTEKPSSPGHLPAKRTNDMPQVNSANDIDNAANHKDVSKPTSSRHSASKGAIKKYPAPQPPNGGKKHKEAKFKSSSDPEDAARHAHGVQHPPEFSQIRNLPMYMAMMREQNQLGEERTPRNLPPGPPVLNPPSKLEKLRTTNTSEIMETNGEKIKQTKNTQNHNVNNHLEFAYAPMSPEEMIKRLMGRDSTVLAANSPNGGASKPKNEDRRSRVSEHHYESVDFSPTGSPQADAPEEAQTPAQPVDRFMEIKNDLRSLRKELKECSSPLEVRKTVNVNQEAANLPAKNVNVIKGGGTRGDNLQLNLPAHNLGNVNQKTWNNQWNVASNQPQNQSAANFVKLPCEFCKVMVPSEQLVDHELHCHNEAANAYPEPNFPDSSPSPTSNTKNHLNQHTNLNPVPNNINGIPFSRIDDLRFKTPRHKKGRLQKNVDPNDLSPHNMVNDQANSWSKMRRKFQGADSDEFPSARRNENEVWNTSNERVDNDWANVRPHNARGDEDRPDNFARSPEDVENTDNNQVELNGVMIPCEFCNTVISAQDFVLHETGCNPIYTSIMPPKDQKNHNADNVPPNTPDGQPAPRNKPNRNPKKPLSQHEDERGLSDRPRRNRYQFEQLTEPRAVDVDWDEEAFGRCDDVQLPCEFCMLPIAASHLMEHQKLCFPEFH